MSYQKLKLKDLLVPISKQIQPKDFGDKVYVGLEHLKSGDVSLTDVGTASQVKSTKWEFQSGDILYGKLRPYLNKCAVANKNGICSTDILVLRANKNVDARYVAYCLTGDDFVTYANGTVSGMNLPRTTWSKFNDYEILVPVTNDGKPDLAEQQRTVSKLDKVFQGLGNGTSVLLKQKENVALLRQSTLSRAFVNQEWQLTKIRDLNPVLLKGVSFDKADAQMTKYDGYAPLLRAHNIRDMRINFDEMMYVRNTAVKDEQYLKNGDVVFVTSSGSKHLVGKSALITHLDTETTIGAFNSLLRFTSNVEPRYVFFALNSPLFKQHIAKRLVGANINNIKKDDILDFEFRVPFKNGIPDIKEQVRVADEIDMAFSSSEKLHSIFGKQELAFSSLRSSVLSQSFKMQT